MRRPRKRWLLTLKITLGSAFLTTLIATCVELSSSEDVTRVSTGPQPPPFNSLIVTDAAIAGLYFGLLIGLVVNAVAMIIEEPRPHW